MFLFTIAGNGHVHELDVTTLEEWNRIVEHPTSRRELYLKTFTRELFDELTSERNADWRASVRASSAERKELVLVDAVGTALAAIELAFYSCDGSDETYGAWLEIAVDPSRRGKGIGTAVASTLPTWLAHEVPGGHCFADVCTNNIWSTGMLTSAGWVAASDGACNVHDAGHVCAGRAVRFCAHPSHTTP